MAKDTLPVNYQDDILGSAMSGLRRYKMITNSDGTVSFQDATTYDQTGSNFGATDINQTNAAVNENTAQLRELTEMYINGEIVTMLADEDGYVLTDGDGLALVNTEKIHILS